MNKLIALAAGAAASAACASMSLVSTGVAAADPDVVGQAYWEAKGALSQAGMTPVVATVLGANCRTTSATSSAHRNRGSWIRAGIQRET